MPRKIFKNHNREAAFIIKVKPYLMKQSAVILTKITEIQSRNSEANSNPISWANQEITENNTKPRNVGAKKNVPWYWHFLSRVSNNLKQIGSSSTARTRSPTGKLSTSPLISSTVIVFAPNQARGEKGGE